MFLVQQIRHAKPQMTLSSDYPVLLGSRVENICTLPLSGLRGGPLPLGAGGPRVVLVSGISGNGSSCIALHFNWFACFGFALPCTCMARIARLPEIRRSGALGIRTSVEPDSPCRSEIRSSQTRGVLPFCCSILGSVSRSRRCNI